MSKNLEVELKYQILNDSQIQGFLEDLEFVGEKKVVDDYLDTENADLYKRGIFIRVRNGKSLDIKFNPYDVANPDEISDHGHCDEYSYDLPLEDSDLESINEVMDILGMNKVVKANLEEFKKANSLVISIHFDKTRKTYKSGEFEIVYDDVLDFDRYIEVEYSGSGNDVESIKDRIREFVKGLDLKLITTGYNELYWRKNNFDIYLQGRFFLDEDRELFRERFGI